MYLNRLYCNKPDVFSPLVFNRGLNVVLAAVKMRKDMKKDSHNLGKSLLIDLFEFMLLKDVGQDLFLKKHGDLFSEFEFYLDVAMENGGFLTEKEL
jgi:uncharacterized protein YydD (DUF2326 family)